MTINNLEYRHGAIFNGTFRLRHPFSKIAKNGSPFLSVTLEDATGEIKAYSWSKKISSTIYKDFDCVNLTGKIREFNSTWIADVHEAERIESKPEYPLTLIPQSVCPLPALLQQLNDLVRSISNNAIRGFVESVLADDEIAFPFISAPASRQHHHSIAGGLLQHSLECVAMVSRFIEFTDAELELGIVGALFHDVGKTRTLKSVGKLTSIGFICDHDSLTLEVLAPHLHRLDAICPDAAIALRYLWTWRNGKNHRPIPLITIADAIAAADRISSGLNVQEAAFRDQPEWHNFARFGDNNSFWRPLLEMRA